MLLRIGVEMTMPGDTSPVQKQMICLESPTFNASTQGMKLFLTAALITAALCSTFAQTRIAIRGSFHQSTAVVKDGIQPLNTGFVTNGGAGIYFKAPFDGVLHFSPYAAIQGRGYRFTPLTGPVSNVQTQLVYLDLVPALSVDFPSGKGNHWVVSFGPNFSMGLFGTEKKTTNGTTTSTKVKFSSTSGIGLYDVGLNTAIGYHTPKWLVELGYMHGLASINNEEEFDKINIRNRVLGLTLGFYLK
jgi:hypothetical protein